MIAAVELMASNNKVTDPAGIIATQILQMNSGINDFSSEEEHFKYVL